MCVYVDGAHYQSVNLSILHALSDAVKNFFRCKKVVYINDKVKRIADIITDDNNADGAAKVIEQFFERKEYR